MENNNLESTPIPNERAFVSPEQIERTVMTATAEALTTLRLNLPELPGVYKYLDANRTVIYVGKAINLKRRVNSYFTRSHPDLKTRLLVRAIRDIEFVVTHNDLEALLLENNLIKQYQPKYNIALKDGKSYPFICIKNERFPRVFATRQRLKDGSAYFGPYPNVSTMNTLLHFIRENFKIRTCSYNLSEQAIAGKKYRPCLEYHIGKCFAPCVGNQSLESYEEDVQQIKAILQGSFNAVLEKLRSQMDAAAKTLDFERAQYLKNRFEQVQKHRRKSTVVSESITDVEVLTALTLENLCVVNHFQMFKGMIVKTHVFDVWLKMGENQNDVFAAVLTRLAAEDPVFSKTIYTNLTIDDPELTTGFEVLVPTEGDPLRVVELSVRNCQVLLDEKVNLSRIKKVPSELALLEQAKKDLRLVKVPDYIECIDNSNIQGTTPVSAVVVFRNGKPSKRDYRVYNIETVEGPDDFATMREVVTRRYGKMKAEGLPLPDLLVIDGGKGQLSSVIEALKQLGLDTSIAVISIAKRLEEIYYKDDPYPLHLDKKGTTLRLIQRMRDEAHKTGVSAHRTRRDKKTLTSGLVELKGVGTATAKKLLSHFKSVKKIESASIAELAEVVGEARAKKIYEQYRNKTQPQSL